MALFADFFAEQYDELYSSKNYQVECDLIEEAVRRYATSTPKDILDVGCGTGGHSIEMARRGYSVTGIDLSQSMLDEAINKSILLNTSNRPRWLCGDVRSFDTGCQYDLAVMMFAVVGYMTSNSDVLTALGNIRRHLKPKALLICDFWSGPSVLTLGVVDRVREIQTHTGKVIRASSTTLDITKHVADVTFKLWTLKEDRLVDQACETHHLRYFFPLEFELFLSNAGFELISLTAFPSLDDPLSSKSWNAIAVCSVV